MAADQRPSGGRINTQRRNVKPTGRNQTLGKFSCACGNTGELFNTGYSGPLPFAQSVSSWYTAYGSRRREMPREGVGVASTLHRKGITWKRTKCPRSERKKCVLAR